MRIDIQEINDVTLLELDGHLSGPDSMSLADAVCQKVSANMNKFVIDMEHVSFVDSRGLGALITALKAVQPYAGKIRVCSLDSQVNAIFELTRLHRLFEIFSDQRQALRSFELPPDRFWHSRSAQLSSSCKLAV